MECETSNMADLYDHVAALLHPLPQPGEVDPPEAADAAVDAVGQARKQTAEMLRLAAEETADQGWEQADPLLASLRMLRARQRAAEEGVRALLAYAREFSRPAPYRLADLAGAAGMSISGVRVAYTADDVRRVEQATGLRRRDPGRDR
jgi:hypothetical protein